MRIFLTIIKRDLALAFKKGSGTLTLVAFFVIAASLFAFGVGPEPELLNSVSTGVIWVCALLASMLGLPRLFEEDYEDGSLAQLMLQQALPEVVVMAKILAHWLASGVPLVLAVPLIAMLLNVDGQAVGLLTLSLLVGTLVLSMIGAVGASLTLGLKRGGGLVGVLVLPLYIPVLIFGVAASAQGADFSSNFSLLAGLVLLMLPVSVIASTAAVKMAAQEG